jgi:hypothetical protein
MNCNIWIFIGRNRGSRLGWGLPYLKNAFLALTNSQSENTLLARMNPDKIKHGWCPECRLLTWFDVEGAFVCNRCGTGLKRRDELPHITRKLFDFQSWSDGLSIRGLAGLSPGGAAEELGCHRTMIDKLVQQGVLERSIYNKDGYYSIEISERSIVKALENKQKTGKWTGSGKESKTGLWKWVRKNS